ncbi:Phosphotransferase enzyme [Arachnomyces sp. PD_36]|nr:Phosphotransferase enzyme [Arachnomyces sp. PD_36]
MADARHSPTAGEHLFSYTSGRFLFNEHLRREERHVPFNVEALKEVAAQSIEPSHGKVTKMEKLAEGGFNRVFLLTMEDGFQAIAKIPYKIALPRFHATASEAATLEFLRSKGVPVPKLYSYSASVDNPAGVEYIIMEKATGVPIETKWFSMTKRERHKLASSFVEIEKKFFDLPFDSIGSLYFKHDLPLNLQAPLYSKHHKEKEEDSTGNFCIGPIADYMFSYGKRAGLDIYRGPWRNAKDYLRAIAGKEIDSTRKYGTPLELDFPHNGPFPGEHDPKQYIALLEKYLALVPYLLPKDELDPRNQPTLRHPDLNPGNILISPETGAVSCIIDWQHTTVEPRLLVAGYPRAFENPETEESLDLEEPKLPSGYDSLSTDQKAQADELYRRQTLFHYYRIFNGALNKPHLSALRDPLLLPRKHLVDRAGRQWSGNLITLMGALVRMTEYWPHLPDTEGIECPVKFKQDELETFHKCEEIWFALNAVVNQWRDQIGINEDGWVNNEGYEDAVRRAGELRDNLVVEMDGDEEDIALLNKGWPFRDHEEFI